MPRPLLIASLVASLLIGGSFVRPARGDGDDKPADKPTDKPTTIKGWGRVVDPDGDCSVALDPDGQKVNVTVPASPHDFAAELDRRNAPRVMSSVKGDFVIEVTVAGEFKPDGPGTIDGRTPYNGAGLLAVADKDNYVSLHRAALQRGNGELQHYLNFELRKDGKQVTSRFQIALEDGPDTKLRLERRGSKFTASFSQDDGEHWQAYAEPIEADLRPKLTCGVEAVNSAKDAFTCSFEAYGVFQRVAAK